MLDWGGTAEKGFTAVSRAFLRHYRDLGLEMAEAMLILHILDFQWGSGLPFPKVETLCELTGKSEKTVRTWIRSLRGKGLLRTRSHAGRSNEYDFGPLFAKLSALKDLKDCDSVMSDNLGRLPSTADDSATVNVASVQSGRTTTEASSKAHEPKVLTLSDGAKYDGETGEILEEPGDSFDDFELIDPDDQSEETTQKLPSQAIQEVPSQATPKLPSRITIKEEQEPKKKAAPHLNLDALVNAAVENVKRKHQTKRVPPGPKKQSPMIQRLLDKSPEKYNCNDVLLLFRYEWGKKWETPLASFGGKERALMKKLIEEYGGALVAKVVQSAIREWGKWKTEFGASGYPSPSFIFGFRQSLFPAVLEAKSEDSKPSWGSHFKPSSSTEDGDEIGW